MWLGHVDYFPLPNDCVALVYVKLYWRDLESNYCTPKVLDRIIFGIPDFTVGISWCVHLFNPVGHA